jgi:hypothetical protein
MEERKLKDEMQYWYSKYCNTVIRPEAEAYLNVYNALKAVYDLWYGKK